jgi:hypothetical protein
VLLLRNKEDLEFRCKIQYIEQQLLTHTSTIQVFHSNGNEPLESVTGHVPNDNSGGGQLQLGIAKKPTETDTVVWDGYQERIMQGEGQIYGGVFVEDSLGGCISR